MLNLGVIDPTKLTELPIDQQQMICDYLLKNKAQVVFLPSQDHEMVFNDLVYTFQFSHLILARTRHRDPEAARFEIRGGAEAWGGASSFFRGRGTLIPEDNVLKWVNKNRSIKQMSDEEIAESEMILESEIAAVMLPGTKRILTDPHTKISYLIMPHIEGDTLEELIEEDRYGAKQLSVDVKLQITIQLLRAIQEMHDHHFLHLDIKLANIIFNQVLNQLTLVDFGLAVKGKQVVIHGPWGAYSNRPPEQEAVSGMVDQNSDSFAAGQTIKSLWNLPYVVTTSGPIPGLSNNHHERLISTIVKMTDKKQHARLDISTALALVEQIQLERKLDKLHILPNTKEAKLMQASYDLAQMCRANYRSFMATKKPANILAVIELFPAIKNIYALETLPDNNEMAIKAFTETLGVRSFLEVKHKQAIINKINIMEKNLKHHHQEIEKIYQFIAMTHYHAKITPAEITLLMKEVDLIATKNKKYMLTIDHLETLTHKYANALEKLKNKWRQKGIDITYDPSNELEGLPADFNTKLASG